MRDLRKELPPDKKSAFFKVRACTMAHRFLIAACVAALTLSLDFGAVDSIRTGLWVRSKNRHPIPRTLAAGTPRWVSGI